MTIDDTNVQLIIEPTLKLEIGQYQIEIQVNFDEDPEATFVSQIFNLIVNPCQITKYEMTQPIENIEYRVGDTFESGTYLFTATPASCNYPVTEVNVNGGPDYLMHNIIDSHFSIESNTALSETFTVTVTSIIQFPSDYTDANMNEFSQSFTFELKVTNPCETDASIQAFSMSPIQAYIHGLATVVPLPEKLEATEQNCGDVAIEIVDAAAHSSYLRIEGNDLVLESVRNSDEGSQIVQIRAFLQDFPSTQTLTNLEVTLDPCRLLDFSISIADSSYTIGSGPFESTSFSIETDPVNCNNYEISSSLSDQPSFIVISDDA